MFFAVGGTVLDIEDSNQLTLTYTQSWNPVEDVVDAG